MNNKLVKIAVLAVGIYQYPVMASSVAIDKIYDPYVNALEHELEYRVVDFQGSKNKLDNAQQHKLAYGQAINEKWFAEIYITGSNAANKNLDPASYNDLSTDDYEELYGDDDNIATLKNPHSNDAGNLTADGYAVEFKWQATEQGEYAFDTGFLFEVEHEQSAGVWEACTGLLLSKEISQVTFTTNVFLIYEYGKDTPTEFEQAANFQFIYRLSPSFEPAIEIYRAQNTFGIGPVIMGTERLQAGKKLHWELGVIAGVIQETPDASIRGLLEFEF